MKYIDIHAHLNFSDFDEDREEVIHRTIDQKMGVINIGTNLKTSKEVVELTEYTNFFACVGIHPTEIDMVFDMNQAREELKKLATENDKVVGIGECGLDYFHIDGDIKEYKDRQKEIFKMQIELSKELKLPLMIHCRDAYHHLIEILEEYQGEVFGNVHFFAGSIDDAKRLMDLGFTISFTGVATFAPQYQELIEFVPLEKMHAETDSPFVAPVPFRGKRNEPLYTLEVIKKISEIKGLPTQKVEEQLLKNFESLFMRR
jgi:TatD DNase family protein